LTQAVFLRALVDGPCTRAELSTLTGLGSTSVADYIRQLRKQKLIYVAEKTYDARGNRTLEVFAWGPDKPDKQIKPKSPRVRTAEYRLRKQVNQLHTHWKGNDNASLP
jgi:hypothetical protein